MRLPDSFGRRGTAATLFIASLVTKYVLVFFLPGSSVLPLKGSYQHLVAARNLHYHDRFAVESALNVVLTSEQILASGQPSVLPNRFIAIFYSYLFDIFGFHSTLPVHVSVVASSITIVVLYFVAVRTFTDRVATVFGILCLFSSVVIYEALWIGLYEFGLLLFAVTLLLVFRPTDNEGDYQYPLPIVAAIGGGMGFTFLSRNAFALSFVPLTLYVYVRIAYGGEPDLEFSRGQVFDRLSGLIDKRAMVALVVLCVMFMIVVGGGLALSGALGHTTESRYASDYLGDDSSDERFRNVAGYGHLYPDPYTYHFERVSYLDTVSDTENPGMISFMKQYGHKTTWEQDQRLYLNSALYYVTGFFTPNAVFPPSPLVLLLLGTGAAVLFAQRSTLAVTFLGWVGFLYIAYIGLWTSNWDHFLEVLFPVLAIQSLGFVHLYDHVSAWLADSRFDCTLLTSERFLTLVAVGILVVHSVGTAGLGLYLPLTSNHSSEVMSTAERTDARLANDSAVLAYSSSNGYDINYYANVSVVRFTPQTVVRLLEERRLKSAFERFEVTAIAGYNRTVSCRIQNQKAVTVVESYAC